MPMQFIGLCNCNAVASAMLRLDTTSTCRACLDVPTSYPRLLSTKPYPDTRTLNTVFTVCVSDVTNKTDIRIRCTFALRRAFKTELKVIISSF